ncbi:hypothetical protein J6590_091294 [Homalodisca vitripennis]|nr:hypothetical protein J6590_091294 [Homalodisca vitripennis]
MSDRDSPPDLHTAVKVQHSKESYRIVSQTSLPRGLRNIVTRTYCRFSESHKRFRVSNNQITTEKGYNEDEFSPHDTLLATNCLVI